LPNKGDCTSGTFRGTLYSFDNCIAPRLAQPLHCSGIETTQVKAPKHANTRSNIRRVLIDRQLVRSWTDCNVKSWTILNLAFPKYRKLGRPLSVKRTWELNGGYKCVCGDGDNLTCYSRKILACAPVTPLRCSAVKIVLAYRVLRHTQTIAPSIECFCEWDPSV
jgi:hypothetical protein